MPGPVLLSWCVDVGGHRCKCEPSLWCLILKPPKSDGHYRFHHSSGLAQISRGALGQREVNRRPQISYAPKGKVTCAFQETVLLHESQEKEREEEEKRRKWGQGRGVRGKGRRRGGG